MTKREKRFVVGGLLSISAIVVVGRVLPAVSRWTASLSVEARLLEGEVSRAEADIRSHDTVRDSLVVRRDALHGLSPWILPGSGETALAGLARLLRDLADSSGVQLGNLELIPDTSRGNAFETPRARLDVTGDDQGISAFLGNVDAVEPRISIVAVTLTQPSPFAAGTQAEMLHAVIAVEAVAALPAIDNSPVHPGRSK